MPAAFGISAIVAAITPTVAESSTASQRSDIAGAPGLAPGLTAQNEEPAPVSNIRLLAFRAVLRASSIARLEPEDVTRPAASFSSSLLRQPEPGSKSRRF